MVEVLQANILHTKVIHQEAKLNWQPFVPPQSWNGGCFVVPLCFQAFAEEVVGQDASLWQAIASAVDFEVDPAILITSLEVVFVAEFGWDVGDFDANVLGVLHWCVQVEVFQVNGAEPRTLP